FFQLTGEKEVAADIQVHANGAAPCGPHPWIGIDRSNSHADSKVGSKKEFIEEVVFEGDLSDPAEVGPLPREPNAPATLRATKLEREMRLRCGVFKPVRGGERRDSRHKNEADVTAALFLRRGRGDRRGCARGRGCGLRRRNRTRLGIADVN